MSSTMELTHDHLEQIGTYVREHLGEWICVAEPPVVVRMDAHYLERMVRIEEELKAQRELMQQGFGSMEKRFEEARADRKAGFDQARRNTNVWMTVPAIVIAIAGFAGPLIAAIIV